MENRERTPERYGRTRQSEKIRGKKSGRRARRKRKRLFWKFLIVLLCLLLLWDIKLRTGEASAGGGSTAVFSLPRVLGEKSETSSQESYLRQFGAMEVQAPVKRNEMEVRLKIEELGKENDVIREIYDNYEAYPDNLMEALANNPEMADFASGYLDAPKEAQGGVTKEEKKEPYPLFLQWDSRWGYVPYGDGSCIGLAGCGPTCLSMAVYALTGDETATPDAIAAYSMENGYYIEGTGTAWALMEDVPPLYGLSVSHPGNGEGGFKRELDQGNVLICAMRPGDFTTAGHFIVLYGYDETGFLVNDPNCAARSGRTWTYEELSGQIKQIWSLKRR